MTTINSDNEYKDEDPLVHHDEDDENDKNNSTF